MNKTKKKENTRAITKTLNKIPQKLFLLPFILFVVVRHKEFKFIKKFVLFV